MMACVATSTKSTPSVLDTNGKERETLTLHSITFSWSSWEEKPEGESGGSQRYRRSSTNRYLGDQLQVEGSGDLQLLPDGVHDHHDPLNGFLVEVLRRRHQSGIARVHAGVLHVLRNGDSHHHAVTGDGVDVYLL